MKSRNRLICVAAALAVTGFAVTANAAPPPIYVHMNGANMFLEDVVAVRPGQKVVFVNEDTGEHTIIGYNRSTGAASKTFDGTVTGTKGPGDKLPTYTISFHRQGLHYYYCSVHAMLKKESGGGFMPTLRPGVGGFGDPMAGLIIVTTDKTLLQEGVISPNPRNF